MKYWTGIALSLALLAGFSMPIEAKESRGSNPTEKMDTDADGKVSRDEWTAYYSEKFTERDADGDGFVTSEEMKTFRGSRGGKRGDREEKTD